MWGALEFIIKPTTPIVITSAQPFTTTLIHSNRDQFKYTWVWDKGSGTGFLDAKRKPLRCHEDIVVFYQKQPTYNPQKWLGPPNHSRKPKKSDGSVVYHGGFNHTASDVSGLKYPRSIIVFPKHTSRENLHPSQKPLGLFEYLIKTYTNEGDTVLDFCAGSGTTLLAARNTGRKFIGIEKEPKFIEVIKERLYEQ